MSKNVYVNGHLYFSNEVGDMYRDGEYLGHTYNDDHRKIANRNYIKDAMLAKMPGVVVESMSLEKLQAIRQHYIDGIDIYVNYIDLGQSKVKEKNKRYDTCVTFLNRLIVSKGGESVQIWYQP